MEPGSSAFQADSIPAELPGKLKPLLTLSIRFLQRGNKRIFILKNLFLPSCVIFIFYFLLYLTAYMDFPGGSVVKNPPANAGDVELILG